MIDQRSPIPMYQQIKEDLREKIQTGVYQPDERIPTEKELVAHYNVSIITVRRAVRELVEEGLLDKKQGKGTFVLRKPFARPFTEQGMSFTEICHANGMKASAKLLHGDVVQGDADVLTKLGLPEGSKVIYIRRLRFADDRPIVIETTCFPIRYAYLLDEDLDRHSMYDILRKNEPGITVTVPPGSRSIQIARADQETADLLQLGEDNHVMLIDGVCNNGLTNQPLHSTHHIGYSEMIGFKFYI